MTSQQHTPLFGPAERRGWRDILRFRPLASASHAALVLTRRGRLIGVVPANGARTLSDYLTWPFEYHEVDTREHTATFSQRLMSSDADQAFDATVRIVYQVDRPERTVFGLENPLAELERLIVQHMLSSGRAFGVDHARELEEHLGLLITQGDAIRQRAAELGLAVRRAEAMIELDEQARGFADELRHRSRERPIHFEYTIDSFDAERDFDVVVGGFYRLIDRTKTDADDIADAIRQSVARTLRRIGITFAPSDYLKAAAAMSEALRADAILQSELTMVNVQLMRPTVQIQPDRSMIVAAPVPEAPVVQPAERVVSTEAAATFAETADTPTVPSLRPARRRLVIAEPPWMNEQTPAGNEPGPEERERSVGEIALTESAKQDVPFAVDAAAPAEEPAAADALSTPAPQAAATVNDTAFPSWLDGVFSQPAQQETDASLEPAAISVDVTDMLSQPKNDVALQFFLEEAFEPAATNEMLRVVEPEAMEPELLESTHLYVNELDAANLAGGEDFESYIQAWEGPKRVETAPQPSDPLASDVEPNETMLAEPIVSFLSLLNMQGPAVFKMRIFELCERPDQLPDVLAELTIDGWILNQASEPRHQEALMRALQLSPDQIAALLAQRAAEHEPEQSAEQSDMPDWMQLRQRWSNGGEE